MPFKDIRTGNWCFFFCDRQPIINKNKNNNRTKPNSVARCFLLLPTVGPPPSPQTPSLPSAPPPPSSFPAGPAPAPGGPGGTMARSLLPETQPGLPEGIAAKPGPSAPSVGQIPPDSATPAGDSIPIAWERQGEVITTLEPSTWRLGTRKMERLGRNSLGSRAEDFFLGSGARIAAYDPLPPPPAPVPCSDSVRLNYRPNRPVRTILLTPPPPPSPTPSSPSPALAPG